MVARAPIETILVVFPTFLLTGEGLMAWKFLYLLRKAYPRARIDHLLGVHGVAPELAGLPLHDWADVTIAAPEAWRVARRQVWHNPLRHDHGDLLARYDLLVDLERVIWRSLVLRHVPHRFSLLPAADGLFARGRGLSGRAPPHVIMVLVWLLARIDPGALPRVLAAPPPPSIVLPDVARVAAQFMNELGAEHEWIGLFPGSGSPRRRWPLEKYIELAHSIHARRADIKQVTGRVVAPVFVLGPHEGSMRARLTESLGADAAVIAPANPSLGLTVAVAQRCWRVVLQDGGASHLVGHAGVPMLELFGPTAPAHYVATARHIAVLDAGSAEGFARLLPESVLHAIVPELCGEKPQFHDFASRALRANNRVLRGTTDRYFLPPEYMKQFIDWWCD